VPLSADTRRTYVSRVRMYLARLADGSGHRRFRGDPLTNPVARDWAIRDYRLYLLREATPKRSVRYSNNALAALDDFYVRLGPGKANLRRDEAPKTGPKAMDANAEIRFFVGLPFGAFALVVGASLGLVADLGDRHDVESRVQPAVAVSGQVVPFYLARGRFQGCNAAVGGERRRGTEPIDACGAGQDLGGEQVTDAMNFGEGGAGVGHRGGDLVGHRRDPVVQPADLCHQLYRQGPQGPAQGFSRPHATQGHCRPAQADIGRPRPDLRAGSAAPENTPDRAPGQPWHASALACRSRQAAMGPTSERRWPPCSRPPASSRAVRLRLWSNRHLAPARPTSTSRRLPAQGARLTTTENGVRQERRSVLRQFRFFENR